MRHLISRLHLNYGQKLFLIATLPLILTAVAISVVVTLQSRQLAEREIETLEAQLIEAKRAELKNYLSIARTAFVNIYGRAAPDDDRAKLLVTQILAGMLYGQDGYFFVYDYEGTNLVSPRRTELIGRNWTGLEDPSGRPVTDELIRLARSGGGYHSYEWPKPSTGERAQMVAYVAGLQDWRWAIGTGVFIDDVVATVAKSREKVEARVERTFLYIGAAMLAALLFVFVSGLFINIRERRLADAKLKRLTQRVFDAQEEERSRVARELHDGISQILVGVRYALDTAKRRLAAGDARAADTLERGITHLSGAIQEVRRISRDLRPGVLDDEAKIALYRVAQEALTNIERHSGATHVAIDVRGHLNGATLRITDNGCGLDEAQARQGGSSGLGLRNMQERIDQLDGTLRITSSKSGTGIEASVPLTHLLQPQGQPDPAPRTKAQA